MCLEIIYLTYMYKKDLALNNLQWLICLEPNQTKDIFVSRFSYSAFFKLYTHPGSSTFSVQRP